MAKTIRHKPPMRSAGKRLFDHIRSRGVKETKPMRAGDFYRASSLYKLCAREEVLASKYEIDRLDYHRSDASLSVTLDIGNALHDLYRNVLYGPTGEWQGAWRCTCGWDSDEDGLSILPQNGIPALLCPMPLACPACRSSALDDHWTYGGSIGFKEWYVEDRELLICGHPDGWSVTKERTALVDIKSQSTRSFNRSMSFLPGHDIQLMAYLHMTGYSCGELWYVNKSPWGDPSNFVKDVAVEYSPKLFDSYVRRPILEMREGLAGGAIPGRQCPSAQCSRANLCQIKDLCFGI